ncbi:box C/D snoRNA protein 1 [Gastrophryne carolinensis]
MASALLLDALGMEKDSEQLPLTLQPKRKISLSSCETCGCEEAKYKCPRCMKHSCSLPCVKKHKVDAACSGVRDKTAFVSLSTFSDINLLNDYRFLEDTGRVADGASRDPAPHRNTSNKFLNYMKNRARKHGICLKLLPVGFSKRMENSTFYSKKEQRFYWHLKLLFPQCKAEYIEKRIPDNQTLCEILKKYIDPAESDPTIRQRLKQYVTSPSDVKVFMEAEKTKPGEKRYYMLDVNRSLLENLQKKTIMEFPTLHVALKDFTEYTALADQDTFEHLYQAGGATLKQTKFEETFCEVSPGHETSIEDQRCVHVVVGLLYKLEQKTFILTSIFAIGNASLEFLRESLKPRSFVPVQLFTQMHLGKLLVALKVFLYFRYNMMHAHLGIERAVTG